MEAGVKPWPGFVYDLYQKFTLESSKFSFVPLAIYILGETTIIELFFKYMYIGVRKF